MQNATTSADIDARVIAADRLRCQDQLSHGDEVDVAFILFRTTPGVTDAAADARPIIAGVVEQLDFEDLTDGATLGAAVGQLVEDLEAAVNPTLLEQIILFLLSGFVDASVAQALPAGVGSR